MAVSTLVVGAGNVFRRDDGIGPAIASRLRGALSCDVQVLVQEGDFLAMIDHWQSLDTVVTIDATSSGSAPGTIRRYEAHSRPLPSTFSRSSTHACGLAEAIELARVLGRLPARLVVFGIEGRDFAQGEGLSPEVAGAIDEVVRRVTREVTACG